ncbi:lipase member I [Leptonychotes weddellii]|uniref:Lipase member I n=1 Tax=Leptonychotes weddellii TaxID=9713 RepID=A0A7F8R270_LEPWE|nr:lipase member I [Leptonychotes weddellii]
MNFRISFLLNLRAAFTFIGFPMRVYIFLCLMCWARSENKRSCLEFSHLSIKDSFKDLFVPQMEISLMLYTRKNLNCAEPLFEQHNSLNVNFSISKKTVWLIHGYRPTGSSPTWLQNFLRILLNQEDINIIVVDWNRGATTFLYNRAVKNTRKVAVSLSGYIRNLLKHGASLGNFHFIGMSLGAHISGFVGKIFQGQLGRITGLDPAGPKFSGKSFNDRLDYTDAKFVDVIHSDTNGLGIKEPLGHIDFYPNGGKTQPGCPKSILSGIQFIKCDHQRAVYLFMASLETNCNFISFPCPSYEDFKAGSCVDCDNFNEKSCPRLGYQAELWEDVLKEKREETTVFLDTTGASPFCVARASSTMLNKDGGNRHLVLLPILEESIVCYLVKLYFTNMLSILNSLFRKNRSFNELQEVKILAQFLNDVVNISSIGLAYSQSSHWQFITGRYKIQRIMLQSLTYPERPPLCIYNFVLNKNEEVFLNPSTCTSKEI